MIRIEKRTTTKNIHLKKTVEFFKISKKSRLFIKKEATINYKNVLYY